MPTPITLTYPNSSMLVRLNRLHRMKLFTPRGKDAAYILSHLIIPRTTHVYVEPQFGSSSPITAFSPLFWLPRDRSHLSFLDAMSTVRLIRDGGRVDAMVVWAFHDDHNQNQKPCFQVAALVDGDASTRSALIHIGLVFQHSHLTTLELHLPLTQLRGVTADDWVTILSNLPFLTTIRLEIYREESRPKDPGQFVRLLLRVLTVSPLTLDSHPRPY